MNFGAFAGGLAQGYNTTRQTINQSKYANAYEKNMQREQERYDKEKAAETDTINGIANMAQVGPTMLPTTIAGTPQTAPAAAPGTAFNNQLGNIGFMQQQPMINTAFSGRPGYAAGGLVQIPDQVFAGQPQGAYQAGGLSSAPVQPVAQPTPQPAQPAAQPAPQEDPEDAKLTPNQRLTKAIMTTDLLSNPDKLNKAMAIAEANGMGDRVKPWLERAYKAKQGGMIDGAMNLLNGDVDSAMENLSKSGMKLEDRPRKAKPDDPNDQNWIFNISGSGEQTLNVGDLLSRTLDYHKFQEHQLKSKETDAKVRETDADITLKGKQGNYSDAQTEYLKGAKTNEALAAAAERRSRMKNDGGLSDQMKQVMGERKTALDRMAMVKNDIDNKFEPDPQLRQTYENLAYRYQNDLESTMKRSLTPSEHSHLTYMLTQYPKDGDPEKVRAWQQQLVSSFGGEAPQAAAPAAAPQAVAARPAAATPAAALQSPEALAAPYKGSADYEAMLGVQRALQTPGLDVRQKQNLALQAQEIAARHAQKYGSRT